MDILFGITIEVNPDEPNSDVYLDGRHLGFINPFDVVLTYKDGKEKLEVQYEAICRNESKVFDSLVNAVQWLREHDYDELYLAYQREKSNGAFWESFARSWVIDQFNAGAEYIQTIKLLREKTGAGLKEAKDFIDKTTGGGKIWDTERGIMSYQY